MVDYTKLTTFPFKSALNFRLLVEYWENAIRHQAPAFAKVIQERINEAPELRKPIEDLTLLEKHKDLISFLLTAAIAPAQEEFEMSAAMVPFQFETIYQTKAFKREIDLSHVERSAKINAAKNVVAGKTIHACLLILQKYYGVELTRELTIDKPILFTIHNPITGLERVYKVEIGRQFFEIIAKTELEPIDPNVIKFLTEKVYDVDLWLQYIKPENFEFHGFMIMRMIDVTEQEMVSSIKYDLLEKHAVTKQEKFAVIEQKLRSIFSMPDLKLGIAYFDASNRIIVSSGDGAQAWKSLSENDLSPCENFTGSVYERSWTEKRYITIENLETYPYKTIVETTLLNKGVKNILLAPLIDDEETIGMLELATGVPGKLNPISANKVENVLPMFTAALKRVKEEMSTEIRAIIQEECTNIHPTVQWRFIEAGTNVLAKRRRGEKTTFEEIAFKDVYPLFGLADVRNSSTERNAAIQHDLQQNLKMAKDLLVKIQMQRKLPILEEVIFKIEHQNDKLAKELASGDESDVIQFLKEEINPLISHFDNDPEFKKAITRYRQNLDPVFGVVYKRRKGFEESLSIINKMIGNHLDEAQVTAQQMFPHYFEKYQTDGVEYTLYLGSSLTKDKIFDPLYLKNFRLWQLLMMCEIDKKMDALKPKLKNNLDITQLILVHDQSLAIRFRPDEKQFDVEGAYDIRYEIVKKRIDKAYIKNTGERLTQPGKIAIVYNQTKVEEEYKRYFEYLIAKKFITPNIEELELEELPGAKGLRAFRIEITKDVKVIASPQDDLLKDIKQALHLQ
ncbi:MAG TPA: GAF domain-containing protein [Cyclobacteriaceae bacterium]